MAAPLSCMEAEVVSAATGMSPSTVNKSSYSRPTIPYPLYYFLPAFVTRGGQFGEQGGQIRRRPLHCKRVGRRRGGGSAPFLRRPLGLGTLAGLGGLASGRSWALIAVPS